jgi:hypothetical protein
MDKALFDDIVGFLRAYVSKWSLAMSGALSVPLAMVGVLWPNGPVRTVLFVTAATCFVVLYEPDERRFVETENFNLDWLTKRLSVCVRNTGKLQASNCQVFFEKINAERRQLGGRPRPNSARPNTGGRRKRAAAVAGPLKERGRALAFLLRRKSVLIATPWRR